MKERGGLWGRRLPASHLAMLAAAATGNTVLAVAPRQGSLADGLSFVSPAPSCTTTTTTRHARPAIAGLSSIVGRPSTSAVHRQPAPPGHGFAGISARWVKRRGERLGQARAEGAAAGAEGGDDDDAEEQERKRALGELDRR